MLNSMMWTERLPGATITNYAITLWIMLLLLHIGQTKCTPGRLKPYKGKHLISQ